MKARWSTVGGICVLVLVLAPVLVMLAATLEGDVSRRWSRLDGVVMDALVNSLVMAGLATLFAIVLAVPMALALHRTEFPGRRLLGVAYIVPLLIPPHIHAISWLRVFGNKGYLTEWLEQTWGYRLDVREGFWQVAGQDFIYPGPIWMMTFAFWPLAALIVSAGLTQLDGRFEEAALLSAGRRRMLRRVTLPLLKPHILVGGFFVFIFSISCYGIPALLQEVPTIMTEIFIVTSNVDSSDAAVIAIPLVVTTITALLAVTFLAGRRVWHGTQTARPVPASLRRRSWGAFAYAWGLILVTAGWPLWSLLNKAGALANYRAVWQNVKPELMSSLILSVLGALVVAVGGTLVALLVVRLGRRRGFLVETLALLPFAFPAIVVGVSTNVFWSRFASVPLIDRYVYRGLGISIFIYLMLFLPFGVRSVKTALGRLSPGLTEAAALAGRSGTATFWRIVLPLIRPGVAAAALLGFVLTLGELGAGLIVSPPEWLSVQVRIFNMIHFARDEEVAALCVMVILMAVIPTALYALLFNRKVEVL